MSLAKNRKRFEQFQKNEEERAERRANAGSTSFTNPNQLKFEAGKTYRLRLLFDEPAEDAYRQGPFLTLYSHGAKDGSGKWINVTCPTTHGREGWDTCPICKNNNKLWESYDATKSAIDKELYDKYKRKFSGYALALVVNDPTNPENNGHAKYFRFSIVQHKWLQREIFGIKSKSRYDEEEDNEDIEKVGYDAFDLEDGVDLIITVTEQGRFLNWDLKFSRKSTAVDYDEKQLNEEIAEINIDGFLRDSSEAELENFYRTIVLEDDNSSADTVDTTETSSDAIDEIDTELSDVMDSNTSDDEIDDEVSDILAELDDMDD